MACRINEVPRDREIVCICACGQRSVPAVHIVMASGDTASSMKNGIISGGWQDSPLIKASQGAIKELVIP